MDTLSFAMDINLSQPFVKSLMLRKTP